MTAPLIITLCAIVVLLILSGFFSGSETALTAASRPRIHQLAEEGDRRAEIVRQLQDTRDRMIGAILLGNNLVNILASALATSVLISLFGEAGVAYATLAMTTLILIFAEVLPKTYAITHAERMALSVAPAMRAVTVVLSPFVTAVRWFVRGTLKLFGAELPEKFAHYTTPEELSGAISLYSGSGVEAARKGGMLASILDLSKVEVGEVMTHRKNIEMIDLETPTETILERIMASRFSRLPLYRDEPDEIVGMLHMRDVLRALRAADNDLEKIDVAKIAKEPWFVPETTSLLDQMRAFQKRGEHVAIVVDEYGALMGLVTLEDILEEIVGDIVDEHDLRVRGVRPQSDGSLIVNGTVTIRDLNRELGWNLPDDEASTIAGLVLHEARVIPDPGQVYEFHNMRFEVLRRQRNQVTSLRITPPAAQDAQAAQEAS